MPNEQGRAVIKAALEKASEIGPQASEGDWIETVTVEAAPFIREWGIADACARSGWEDRETHFADAANMDAGIDVAAKAARRSAHSHPAQIAQTQ